MTDAAFALQGGWPLTLGRASFVAGVLSLGGALVFRIAVAPPACERMDPNDAAWVGAALARWVMLSLAAACAGLAAWTVEQTAAIAGTDGFATWRALWPVLAQTSFGHVVALQALLLLATGTLLTTRWAVVPALACVAAEAAHGHGMARGGYGPLFQLEVIHVLAASVWIGGLLPLLIVVRLASPKAGATAARVFSPVGKWAVGLLAAVALLQAAWLLGSVHALVRTAYGWLVMTKAALFLLLFGFALINRYRLAPALVSGTPDMARRALVGSIAAQSIVGLLTVVAASVLSGLAPGSEMP